MTFSYKTDYTAEGLDRLLSTLKSEGETRTKLEELIASYVDQAQALEDAAFPLIDELSIDGATGDRLDRLGELANVGRGGRSDEDYRRRIRAEIAILTSQGKAADIITVHRLLVGAPSNDADYEEAYPKSALIRARDYLNPYSAAEMEDIGELLQRAAPGGTEVHIVYSNASAYNGNDDFLFHFSNTADTTESSASYGLENGIMAEGI